VACRQHVGARSLNLMRSTWRAVSPICGRVAAEARAQRDLLAGLRRIGCDEISVRKGQRYVKRCR
jgi:transposase